MNTEIWKDVNAKLAAEAKCIKVTTLRGYLNGTRKTNKISLIYA